MDDWKKSYTGGTTTLLAEGSMVLVLQVVERRCGTINYFAWELRTEAKGYRVHTRTREAMLP